MLSDSDACTLDVGEDYVRLSNGVDTVSYNLRLGTFSLSSLKESKVYFDRAYASVTTLGQVYTTREMTYRGVNSIDFRDEKGPAKAVVIRLQAPDKSVEMNVRLSMIRGQPGYTSIIQLRNLSEPVKVVEFNPLVIDVDSETRVATGRTIEDLRFFRNGFNSWDLSQTQRIGKGANLSHWFSLLHNITDESTLFIGFVTTASQLSQVVFVGSDNGEKLDRICSQTQCDNVTIDNRGALASEELYIMGGASPHAAVSMFIDMAATRMNAIRPKQVPTGWCSWYYYLTQPSEEEILANAEFIRDRFGSKVAWIQIDDGYQKAVGDWSENARFSSGLNTLSQKIVDAGFKPGIWVAPFIASEHSQLFRAKPEWFLSDEEGKPQVVGENPLWLGNYYALDLSRQDVVDHIGSIFEKLKSVGFDYFKIDFLHHATHNAVRYDSSITRATMVRRGLQAIRDAVGNSFILGCGAPLAQCIGITDGMRIGNDIGTIWKYTWGGGVYESSINAITRYFMHNRLWLNDPDCILVRQDDSSLTIEEVHLWATIAALSGGVMMFSDRMMEVSEERLRILDRLLPPFSRGARGVDVFRETEPRLFALPIETVLGKWAVVAAINLSEKAINIACPFENLGLEKVPHHIFEFWSEEYEGVAESLNVINLKPHSCRFFCIRPEVEEPSILSTSIHYTQGAIELKDVEWNSETWELSARLRMDSRSSEKIFIVFGSQWIPEDAFLNEEQTKIEMIAPEVIAIAGKFKENQEIRVRFSQQI